MVNSKVNEPSLRAGLRLDAMIASGSFGVVFRGHQLAVKRDVAVKVLHAGFAPDTEPGQLFRDEIHAISAIDHRNVVRVYDAEDTDDGRLYFVMELLEGPTLQQIADAGPLPLPRAMTLIAQLLDGLAAVHAAKRIHADVKPANAIVVGSGVNERVVLIDFGLSRLRRADRSADAVGGTFTYMAPEQIASWQVDERSDVFSAALVLVTLVTGWRRSNNELVPPLGAIADPALRAALGRALALEPAARPTAVDFARALRGGEPDEAPPTGPPPPFRDLSPLTERDRGRLCGRERDVMLLVRRIDTTRPLVLTAPSGTGKTSLLRAGLVPYLDAIGVASVYVPCESGAATSVREALQLRRSARRLVVILDQLEAMLGADEVETLITDLLDAPPDTELCVVLGVREDFVARLLAIPALADGVPQIRLKPLDREGARDALITPLREHGTSLDPALLEALLHDLERAGGEVGSALGWSNHNAVYPPHLQLAGTTLFDTLRPGETEITLEHYRLLGGFDAIVGGHLERCLSELSAEELAVAKELFLCFISSAPTHAVLEEADLVSRCGAHHGVEAVRRVLEWLRARRLVTRRERGDGALWSLVHDSLLPRIEAWLTVQDLDRRRAAELVRFHLRQSRPDNPAVLTARQLAILARFPGLLAELELEWRHRADAVWTPERLVERSRQVARYRRAVLVSAAIALVALMLLMLVRWFEERRMRQLEQRQADLNFGRFELTITAFDWMVDPTGVPRAREIDVGSLPMLDWTLYEPDAEDPDSPGASIESRRFRREGDRHIRAGTLYETVEARGGDAFLVVTGRGMKDEICPASIIPLRRLPGYSQRANLRAIRISVPTCAATRFDMIDIPEGVFIANGLGEPPTQFPADRLPAEVELKMPAFSIDRTEITNAAFAKFTEMSDVHDIWGSSIANALGTSRDDLYPRGDITWSDARAYCRFLGKELPSSMQWQKALRGGTQLPSGPNPSPRRNLPWGAPNTSIRNVGVVPAAIAQTLESSANDRRYPSPVGSFPEDTSPYGVRDLAGNLQEWTNDPERGHEDAPISRRPRVTRGGNWYDTSPKSLVDYMAIENPRSPRAQFPFLGARCASR